MIRRPLVLALGLALALATGCKHGKDRASCDAVGVRFLALAQADLAASKDLDAATRRGVGGLLAPMRDAMVRACREDKWSAEARTCYVDAADATAMRGCDARLTQLQRDLLQKAAARGLE